jgi:hypothetical protein
MQPVDAIHQQQSQDQRPHASLASHIFKYSNVVPDSSKDLFIFSNIQMSFPTLRKTLEKPWNIAVCDQTIDEVTLKVGQDPEFHIHSRFLGVVGKRASAPPRG